MIPIRSRFFSSLFVIAVTSTVVNLNCIPAFSAAGAIDTDTGRIFPVTTPIPMGSAVPVTPEVLTDTNPNVLPMTGPWNFAIKRGQTINGIYVSTDDLNRMLTASSTTGGVGFWNGGVVNAIDGDIGTHWKAADTGPQWVQLDLGGIESVTGLSLDWGDKRISSQYLVQGSADGITWAALSDQTAATSTLANGGDISFPTTKERYIKVSFQNAVQAGRQASDSPQPTAPQIAEIEVTVLESGVPTVWEPSESQDGFESPALNDSTWSRVTVPSNWEIAGFSKPTYNDVDDAVGEYRRSILVPKSFEGSNIYWRFDGVYDGADIYVNGVKAGYHESGYTAFDVDVTDLVRPGEVNVFAVRASKKTSSVDLDTGDYEALGGIYRETFLYKTPLTHFKDITVRTDVDQAHNAATVEASVAVVGTPQKGEIIDAKLVDANGATVGAPVFQTLTGQAQEEQETVNFQIPVSHPQLWSAEKPNLYTLIVVLDSFNTAGRESIQQPVGIRQITISPTQTLLWNGQPIKLAGTARHEVWPNKGAALSDTEWKRDVSLIKETNINAVRTSHYNHARRFLDVCEARGLYILDEVPYCWVGEKIRDPRYLPAFIQRARETFARDKNRPEVLAWSCGNENGPGSNTFAVDKYMHDHDPTRPAFSSQLYGNLPGQSFTDAHYPLPKDIAGVPTAGNIPAPVIYTEQPHMFSAPQNLQFDPNLHDYWGTALKRSWDSIEANPKIIGSFIWEWQNQPVISTWSDTTPNHLGPVTTWFENYKGVVDGYRIPKPEWWNVKEIYSPIQVAQRTLFAMPSVNGQTPRAKVEIENRYSFTDLSEQTCTWSGMKDGVATGSGLIKLSCPPLSKTTVLVPVPAGSTDVRLSFSKPTETYDTYSVVMHVLGRPNPTPPAAMKSAGPLWVQDEQSQYDISNNSETVDISKSSGQITRWLAGTQTVCSFGPVLNFGTTHAVVNQFGTNTKDYIGANSIVSVPNPIIHVKQDAGAVNVTETIALADKAGNALGSETVSYSLTSDNQIGVAWSVSWSGADTRAWEIGMSISPSALDTNMSWYKDSILADYPSDAIGAPTGSCPIAVGSKRDTHWLALSDKTKHGIVLMANGTPLIARIDDAYSPVLYANISQAVDGELSSPWVADQDVVLSKTKPLSGSFSLRAF